MCVCVCTNIKVYSSRQFPSSPLYGPFSVAASVANDQMASWPPKTAIYFSLFFLKEPSSLFRTLNPCWIQAVVILSNTCEEVQEFQGGN